MSRLAVIPIALSPVLALALVSSAAPAQVASSSEKDPAAMAALDRMGATLAKLNEINIHADITAEDVLTTGQKLQYGGTIDTIARRPNNLRMSVKVGPSSREIYYDGKTVSVVVPSASLYATAPAPPTIREMLQQAEDRHGIEVPLADLFQWSSNPASAKAVTSAISAGTESIGGFACDHYAMRQTGADWQIWIRQGAEALPCKIVITMTGDPAQPQFSAVYHWKSEPPPGPEAFTFTPPQGYGPMALGSLKTARKGN